VSGVRPNRAKALLDVGEIAVGAGIASDLVELIEAAAAAGFNLVAFDAEHEPLDDTQLAGLIRAADGFDLAPIVHLARDPSRILRLLEGIRLRRCSTVDNMRAALAACTKFFPLGELPFLSAGPRGTLQWPQG
jgi:staphyloferrin B biosynthesis citrate synthase